MKQGIDAKIPAGSATIQFGIFRKRNDCVLRREVSLKMRSEVCFTFTETKEDNKQGFIAPLPVHLGTEIGSRS